MKKIAYIVYLVLTFILLLFSILSIKGCSNNVKNSTHYEVMEKDLKGYWYHTYSNATLCKI